MTGGGTGGHIYPLLAVREALLDDQAAVEVRYLGARGGPEERLALQHGLPFVGIPAAGVRGLAPWRAAANLGKLAAGVVGALREVRRFAPDAVLVTGGYVSAPAVLAARLAGRPVVICLPDMEPGLAVRLLARLASVVTVSFEEVARRLPPGKAVVTGYPVRRAFRQGTRRAARERLGIGAGERLVVVFGGSQGARSINSAVLGALKGLLELAHVWHITGSADHERVRSSLPEPATCAQGRYRIYSYVENELADFLRAADLVVARAGAATLGELPAAGVPSILVPYPHAGGHQAVNATYLKDRGAALVIEDVDLSQRLLPTVRDLLQDSQRLESMAMAAARLARPAAAAAIVAQLRRAAEG